MVQRLPGFYRIDPVDPRAPSQDAWDRMSLDERARVVAMLPAEIPLVPQQGGYTSEVLGLDLLLEGERLRFRMGMADVPEAEELVARLGAMLNQALLHQQGAEERAAVLEQKLAAAEAMIEELKRGR